MSDWELSFKNQRIGGTGSTLGFSRGASYSCPFLGSQSLGSAAPDQPWPGSLMSPAQDLCLREFGDPSGVAGSILFSFPSGLLIVSETCLYE